MKATFDKAAYLCAKHITQTYSTSFSIGIHLFDRSIQKPIYAIYGFVRYMDEIVDTFENYDREKLLLDFEMEYRKACEQRLSLNPVLHGFQEVVHRYDLSHLVESFIKSMKLDLHKTDYQTADEYESYIYGSANVIGLMCLKVFVDGDPKAYQTLKEKAERMGSAFQKINFLRDLKADLSQLGRSYFPNMKDGQLTETVKQEILAEIAQEFAEVLSGIKMLPNQAKLGVYVSYCYYRSLLSKLKRKKAQDITKHRFRISNAHKMFILLRAYLAYKLKLI